MRPPRTLAEAAERCGAQLRGSGDVEVDGIAGLAEAGPRQVSFFANAAYRQKLGASQAAAIIVSDADARLPELEGRAVLVADPAYAAFARLAQAFHPVPAPKPGVDPRAHVDPEAVVDPTARIEAFAWVGRGARIGARALVQSGAWVGDDAQVGDDSRLYPHVVVRERCVVGARCILHPGAVVGSDGFGFAFDPAGDGEGPLHRKIPQVGIARLEDDVELGANTCVDRATLGETVVGRGAKVDNLVQLAHNVRIGPLTVIAAQVGIAGSTTVGAGVQLGGQAGIVGHIEIGDMARIGAQAGVVHSVAPGLTVQGLPATESRKWARTALLVGRLPELFRELRDLGKRVASLETLSRR